MTESNIPEDLLYTNEHEWVQRTGDTTVRVGITDFAQSQLGDVVFVQLPDADARVCAGDSFGEVESTKSVSDLFSPITAKVIAVNSELESSPELVNTDPYGAGWLVDLEVSDKETLEAALDVILDADSYAEIVGQ
ncbi:MAG: glycine cleavage system protein GcvH [Mycobacteriaceae bacterium]